MKRPPPSHTFHWPTLALGSALLLAANTTWAQFDLTFDPSVPLFKNNAQLSMGWAGGLNFPQVSNIDLDGDGDKDLFFFDRTGDRVITLLSNQAQGSSTWSFSRAFDAVPPFRNLREWALLRDFNGDGKEDLFTYVTGGFACWKNTSTGNDLSFAMYDTLIRSNYYPTEANLYVSQVDIPGIEDIDGDGDLDVSRLDRWLENADGKGEAWIERKTFDFGKEGPWGIQTRAVLVDVDRDGDLDLVQAEGDVLDGRVAWFENLHGNGKEWERHMIKEPGHNQDFHSICVADFDNDGDVDVFSGGGPLTVGEHVWFLWENTGGKGGDWNEHVVQRGQQTHESVCGDIDGDGDIDIFTKPWRGDLHLFVENLLAMPNKVKHPR